MRRMISLAPILLTAACGGSPSSGGTLDPDQGHPVHGNQGVALAAPTEGTCGGLSELARDHEHQLLADRVRVTVAAHAEREALPHAPTTAAPSEEHAELIWLTSGEARMAIIAEELLRHSGGEPLGTWFEGTLPPQWTPVELAQLGAHGVAAVPRELHDTNGDVHLLEAYLEDDQGLVLRVLFVTSSEVARTGGCVSLASTIAAGLRLGERHADDEHGEHTLFGGVAIVVPERHHLIIEHGPEFELFRIVPVLPFNVPAAELEIYVGASPSVSDHATATPRVGTMLGREVTWYDSNDGGYQSSDAIIEGIEGRQLHVLYSADDAHVGALREAAASLHAIAAPQ